MQKGQATKPLVPLLRRVTFTQDEAEFSDLAMKEVGYSNMHVMVSGLTFMFLFILNIHKETPVIC